MILVINSAFYVISYSPTYVPPKIKSFDLKNEPILSYNVGSSERKKLKNKLDEYMKKEFDIPIVIDGKQYRTNLVCYILFYHCLRL